MSTDGSERSVLLESVYGVFRTRAAHGTRVTVYEKCRQRRTFFVVVCERPRGRRETNVIVVYFGPKSVRDVKLKYISCKYAQYVPIASRLALD